MYEKPKQHFLRPRRLIGWALWIVLVAVMYVGFSKWPTGYASGDATTFTATTQPIHFQKGDILKVATFNIHSGIGLDNKKDLARIAGLLDGFDLVGLQETRGYIIAKPQAAELGEILKLNALFSPNEWTRYHNEFGNALLTRLQVLDWERIPLPGTQNSHHRNLLVVHAKLGEKKLVINVAHFDRTIDRKAQLQMVLDIFKSQPEPKLLMGDFNTLIDDELLKPFFEHATEAAISITPESKPPRVDWIFVKGLEVKNAGIRENDASDHPMVWAELELK